MSSTQATEIETTQGQPENESWGEAQTEEATDFFRATIAAWRCRSCGTEFRVDSVLDRNRHLGRSVSCPMCGGKDLARRNGGGQ